MAFVPKPNTGTLWPNDNKKTDTHPDVRGDLNLSRSFLKDMLAKTDDDLIKISVAGWKKEINGKKTLSISASEPYVKPVDNDLPY
jgi:hypothetical protein